VNERADAAVIGGGVMGAAALRYLAELGCRQPVLLERDTLASGSAGHCAGGVRTLFSDELNVRIGLESIRRPQRFEEEVGEQLDLRLDGYLFLLDDPADVERFEADLVHQTAAGIDTRLLMPEGAHEIVPQLAVDDLCGAVFNPVRPLAVRRRAIRARDCARRAERRLSAGRRERPNSGGDAARLSPPTRRDEHRAV
jgi:glycine/D-amino acid oxidase-like deaminating enzyme